MATLGHVAVGMAAGRIYRRAGEAGRVPIAAAMAGWSLLSLLPDCDVVGFGFGVAYADPWGHRGATHSLAFAVLLGLAIGAAGAAVRLPFVRTALCASCVIFSHALLDTLTDGGLGCALLWPFDLTRYFAPWNPISVAPIGRGLLSRAALGVAAIELLLFAPLLAFALWPRPRMGAA